MLKCEEINLAGILGEVISTVSNSDLLSVLDLSSSLDILGEGGGLGGGLGGILGKGTAPLNILGGGGLGGILGKEQQQAPAPPVIALEATSAVSDLGQGRLWARSATYRQPWSLDWRQTQETTDGILNSVVPKDINDALTGLLGNIDLADLLLG